tara:strand:- start:743 stop:934 length:192 start_codon:yes stop_codon:yes gene_type:complete
MNNEESKKTINEKITESILEELELISLSDFQELLDKHDYGDVNDSIDKAIQDLIQILFQERCV